MAQAFIALGANLGDREANLRAALRALTTIAQVEEVSSLYETDPVGPKQPDFYNAACRIETRLEPAPLLRALKGIEKEIGREPGGEKWGPRLIDLDLLLYDDRTVDRPGLTIPHPRMAERAFVLVPLEEIAAEVEVPGAGSVTELVRKAGDEGVRLVKGKGWDGLAGE